MANEGATTNGVEDLWGSGDEESDVEDGAGHALLQIPSDPPTATEGPDQQTSERPRSSSRAAPRRHIPSFQGAFSQARRENRGGGYAIRQNAFHHAGAAGGRGGSSGAGTPVQGGHLTLPPLSGNIGLEGLEALAGGVGYGDLPPDAARFLTALTTDGAPGQDGNHPASGASDGRGGAGGRGQVATSSDHDDDLAKLSAALGQDWSALAAAAAAASTSGNEGGMVAHAPEEVDVELEMAVAEAEAMSRNASSSSNGIGSAQEMVRFGSGTPMSQDTPKDDRLPPIQGKRGSRRGKTKVKFASDTPLSGAGGEDDGRRRSSTAKRRLPAKSEVSQTPAYRRLQMANEALATNGRRSTANRYDLTHASTVSLVDAAKKALADWESAVKTASDPAASLELQRRASRHLALLNGMQRALNVEQVRLQVEESILRNVRGIVKSQTERLVA